MYFFQISFGDSVYIEGDMGRATCVVAMVMILIQLDCLVSMPSGNAVKLDDVTV